MIVLTVIFVGSGLVLAVVSVPLILGWIPPNGKYGLRVRNKMEHPEIWYPVNFSELIKTGRPLAALFLYQKTKL